MLLFSLIVLFTAPQEKDGTERRAAALIQQLRSNDPKDRDEAGRQLKELGRVAAPLLEKAVADRDVEVSARARRALQGIEVREKLTLNLLRVMPGIDERLVTGPETEWRKVLEDALSEVDGKRVYRSLRREDLDALAGPAIRGLRNSESPDIKAFFDIIAKCGLRTAIPELISLVRNRAEGYQWALETLGELRPIEAVPALVSVLEDSANPFHSDALRALQEIGTRGVVRELRRLLTQKNAIHLELFEVLLSLHAGEALPELLTVLQDEHADTRRRAAFELADLHLAGSVKPIEELLNDKNVEVRECAARALARMKIRTALPALLSLIGNPDAHIREQVCCGLGDLGGAESLPPLRRLLKDPEKGVRSMAAFELSALADPGSIPNLIEALKDPDDKVRAWSASALGRSRALNGVREIRALLKDKSDMVRRWSVRALAELGDKEAIPDIAKMLDELGIEGVYALRDLDGRQYTGTIVKLLAVREGDGQIRRAAGEALGYLQARQEIPSIQKLLSDPDYGIRRDALLALSHVGDRQTIELIRPLLEDDHPEVRRAVVLSLERLGDEESDRKLGDLLNDPFIGVRNAAAESFCRRGRKEGVSTLLRDGWDLTLLNAIRTPEAWKRIVAKARSPISIEGPVQLILMRVGQEAGLKVEWPSKDSLIDTWLGLPRWSTRSFSALEIFQDISGNGMYTFILEGEILRILPREDAVSFWSEWWRNLKSKGQ